MSKSLTGCLQIAKKAGRGIMDSDVKLIKEIAAEKGDALAAVEEVISMAEAERDAIISLVQGKEGPKPDAAKAIHVSPHKFEPTADNPLGAFDFTKIGTGEGMQAYGWGIYLATKEKVAKYYHDTFTEERGAAVTYEVYIDDKDMDAMLDFDAPLSEQPSNVQKALRDEIAALTDIAEQSGDTTPITGENIYDILSDIHGDAKTVSRYLFNIGIPGIRYLDGTSRTAGTEGTQNIIVFDTSVAQIIKRDETTLAAALAEAKKKNVKPRGVKSDQLDAVIAELNSALEVTYGKHVVKEINNRRERAQAVLKDAVPTGSGDTNATTAKDMVRDFIAYLHPKDPYRTLLTRYQQSEVDLGKVDVFHVDEATVALHIDSIEEARDTAGLYYHTELGQKHHRTIIINDTYIRNEKVPNPDAYLQAFVHEVTHAVSAEGLRVNSQYGEELESLRKLTIDYLSQYNAYSVDTRTKRPVPKDVFDLMKEHYGLTNVDEFLAEALTNPEFQRLLAKIPHPEGGNATLWTRFIRAIGAMIGMRVPDNSILARVVSLTPDVINEYTDAEIEARRFDESVGERIKKRSEREYIAMQMEQAGVLEDAGFADPDAYPDAVRFNVGPEPTVTRMGMAMRKIMGGGDGGGYKDFWKRPKYYGKEAPANLGTKLLGLMPLDVIETNYKERFEGLGSKGGNPLTQFIKYKQLAQSEAKKFERKADPLFTALKRMERKYVEHVEKFNDTIQDSTMYQVDPSVPWAHDRNKLTRNNNRRKRAAEKVHRKLRAEFKSMPVPMQNMYLRLRNFYENTLTEMKSAVVTNMLEMYKVDTVPGLHDKIMTLSADKISAMAAPVVKYTDATGKVTYKAVDGWDVMSKTFMQFAQLTESNGPYFPLMRFGEYALTFESTTVKTGFASRKAAEAAAADDRADSSGSRTGGYEQMPDGTWSYEHYEKGFMLFESKFDAAEKQKQLEANGFTVSSPFLTQDLDFDKSTAIGSVMALAEKNLKDNDKARLALLSAMISHLPATSMQQRMLKRANIAGASKDTKRVFANYAKSAGHYIATLKYRKRIDENMLDIANASKVAGELHREGATEIGRVHKELVKREKINTEGGTVSQLAAQLGFVNYLLSLSYSVVNSTQVGTMTLPYLSGKYGRVKAARAIGNAYRTVYKDIGSTVLGSWGGAKALVDPGAGDLNDLTNNIIKTLDSNGNAGAASMVKALADRGILEATFSLEMSEGAKLSSERWGRKAFNTMIEAGRFLPYAVEVMNRSVTAISAYHLAIEKGMSQEAAIESAREAVVKTQFDYTVLNRPRYFVANDVLRAMSMFKVHPLGVYSYMIHNVRKALGQNATAEEKKEARRGLSMFVMMHGAFAGAAGSLLAEPIRAALGLINQVFDGDDEDSWLDDPEYALRVMLYELFGDEGVAEVITHGLPRAAGIDMSTRIGLQNLMVMWQEGDTWWESAAGSITKSLFGPIFGYGDSIGRTVAYISGGGEWSRGMEYMYPKQVRDIFRAGRYSSEGMTDWKGVPINNPEDFDRWDYAVRVFGFAPTVEANIYEKRGHARSLTRRIKKKKNALINEWVRAAPEDRARVRAKIDVFNDNLPGDLKRDNVIRHKNLREAQKRRRDAARMTRDGIRVTKKTRGFEERYEAYGTD